MGRAGKRNYDLKRSLELLRRHRHPEGTSPDEEALNLLPLNKRIKKLLNLLRTQPKKPLTMVYLIMYDIENDKIRNRIARYLERNGCVRIQKSVYVARSQPRQFQQIHDTLREVQSYYDNEDSILLIPANQNDLRAMRIIGKQLYLETLLDPPNTLFF